MPLLIQNAIYESPLLSLTESPLRVLQGNQIKRTIEEDTAVWSRLVLGFGPYIPTEWLSAWASPAQFPNFDPPVFSRSCYNLALSLNRIWWQRYKATGPNNSIEIISEAACDEYGNLAESGFYPAEYDSGTQTLSRGAAQYMATPCQLALIDFHAAGLFPPGNYSPAYVRPAVATDNVSPDGGPAGNTWNGGRQNPYYPEVSEQWQVSCHTTHDLPNLYQGERDIYLSATTTVPPWATVFDDTWAEPGWTWTLNHNMDLAWTFRSFGDLAPHDGYTAALESVGAVSTQWTPTIGGVGVQYHGWIADPGFGGCAFTMRRYRYRITTNPPAHYTIARVRTARSVYINGVASGGRTEITEVGSGTLEVGGILSYRQGSPTIPFPDSNPFVESLIDEHHRVIGDFYIVVFDTPLTAWLAARSLSLGVNNVFCGTG